MERGEMGLEDGVYRGNGLGWRIGKISRGGRWGMLGAIQLEVTRLAPCINSKGYGLVRGCADFPKHLP